MRVLVVFLGESIYQRAWDSLVHTHLGVLTTRNDVAMVSFVKMNSHIH